MSIYKLLSIDESGKASYTHLSDLFILTGVVIPEKLKLAIDHKMRRVKKKYFGNEDIVFHGRDMARRGGAFTPLSEQKTEYGFWGEFISLVNNPDITLYFVLTNKEKAKKSGWQTHTILQRSYLRIMSEFARNLKTSNCSGKIVNESEPEEDSCLLYAHNRLQTQGIGDGSITGYEYKKIITSICLVNKSNLDIDVQIADVIGFVGRLKYKIDVLKQTRKMNKVEQMKYRLIDRKLKNSKNPGLFEVLI